MECFEVVTLSWGREACLSSAGEKLGMLSQPQIQQAGETSISVARSNCLLNLLAVKKLDCFAQG